MKKSKYNKIFQYDGKTLAFNARTCALSEIDQDFIRIYDNIENIVYEDLSDKDKKLVDNMMKCCYLISDSTDELAIIKLKSYKSRFGNNSLQLVIAPTMDCNFGCPYCYESPKKGFMSQDVQDKLVSMVKENAERKNSLHITWYGGEPLLAKEIIYDLSEKIIEICAEYKTDYHASIVTNGYLITDSDIEKFNKYKISGAQITVDGMETIHNSRRFLKDNPSEGTFSKIIENIRKLHHAGVHVNIRINIDKTNIEGTKELLLYIKDLGLTKVPINLGLVNDITDLHQDIRKNYFSVSEYSKESLKLQEFLFENGFNSSEYLYYPSLKSRYCGANVINNFVIDPEGYMYKCWNEVGNVSLSVGNILWKDDKYTEEMISREACYLTSTPFDKESCRECSILPLCMGGCPSLLMKTGKSQCEKWKYNLEDTLKKIYEQRTRAK